MPIVVSGAVVLRLPDGKTVTVKCHRHGHVFQLLRDLGIRASTVSQGFIMKGSAEDREAYVSREEALLHAIDCGQLPAEGTGRDELFTEDLW